MGYFVLWWQDIPYKSIPFLSCPATIDFQKTFHFLKRFKNREKTTFSETLKGNHPMRAVWFALNSCFLTWKIHFSGQFAWKTLWQWNLNFGISSFLIGFFIKQNCWYQSEALTVLTAFRGLWSSNSMKKFNLIKIKWKFFRKKIVTFCENHSLTPYKTKWLGSLLVTNQIWQTSFVQPIGIFSKTD